MMPSLRTMDVNRLSGAALLYMLRPPHSLQWQEIHIVREIDDELATELSTLPTLTKLGTISCRSVAFLPALTRLRSLELWMDSEARLSADIVAGLPSCSQLTELMLRNAADVTSRDLSQALPHLSQLRELDLVSCRALDSLSFLSECSGLSQTLHILWLVDCLSPALHSTELKHVMTLKSLTEIKVDSSFAEPLDELSQHLFTPPTAALPNLVHFAYVRD